MGEGIIYETVISTSFFHYTPNKQVFRNLRPEGLGQPMHVGRLGRVGISCALYIHFLPNPGALWKTLSSS